MASGRSSPHFVFAYGSLAAAPVQSDGRPAQPAGRRSPLRAGLIAELPGYRRCWGVAMDNRADLPKYKYYTTPDGRRPAIHVAFLDLVAQDGAEHVVNGVCLPVDAQRLAALDRRERNYARVDVSAVLPSAAGRVWTYVGTEAGRERLRAARRAGTAVIDAGYLRGVQRAFAALGAGEYEACRRSLDPRGLPVRELIRHELP